MRFLLLLIFCFVFAIHTHKFTSKPPILVRPIQFYTYSLRIEQKLHMPRGFQNFNGGSNKFKHLVLNLDYALLLQRMATNPRMI